MNRSELLEAVKEIARRAAARIIEVYEEGFVVERKDDDTPLTAADIAAHQTICEGLAAIDPGTPILSEESVEIPFSVRAKWTRYWLVDPLDGTREFVKRNGEFTVNIALIEGHAPALGVIWVPVGGDCYFAAGGLGAYKQEAGRERGRIRVRPRPAGKIVVAGSRSHGNAATEAFIRNLGESEKIAIGSSLKSCLVAEGTVDVYPRFGPTSEWDTAAAQCIVEEAGGRLTDTDLNPLRYNTKESLLNPHFLVFGDPTVDWRNFVSPGRVS